MPIPRSFLGVVAILLTSANFDPAANATSIATQPFPALTVAAGNIVRWALFPSNHVDPRNVDIWLPPTYDHQTPHKVLYMHDGQMLFDASQS